MWPIGVAPSSHLAQTAWISATRLGFGDDADALLALAEQDLERAMPGSRVGTRPVSISTPTPPRAAISASSW